MEKKLKQAFKQVQSIQGRNMESGEWFSFDVLTIRDSGRSTSFFTVTARRTEESKLIILSFYPFSTDEEINAKLKEIA